MRVLLIQPPFWAVNSPSIGLSYLKASLARAGIHSEIRYSNLDLARRIGRMDYDTIQSGLPVELLFGDVVFGRAMQGSGFSESDVPAFMRAAIAKPPCTRDVPDGFLDRFASFSRLAVAFVQEFEDSRCWEAFDLVGFTTTFTLTPALAMAKALKGISPSIPVVFGGSHCDGSLGLALMNTFPWIDFVARGEGENLIVALAQQLERGERAFDRIDGLVWWEEGRIRQARNEMARVADLDACPFPEYDDWLAELGRLDWRDSNDLRIPIETSRGCWYGDRQRCTFCGLNGLNDRFRVKTAGRIIEEVDRLQCYGMNHINAVDNVLDPRHFKDLIPRLIDRKSTATWFFEIRPTHTKRQLGLLRDAGVRFLQPGLESLSSRLLGLMNKGTRAFQNVRLLRWTAEFGMPVFWNMLCGLPGERASDYDEIAELVPSLTHLFPPLTSCNRIHIDRFSPLFDRHEDSIRPNPAYALAMGLPSGKAAELAYHFELAAEVAMDSDVVQAVERLNQAITRWQEMVGSAAFVSLERDGIRWLYDSRGGGPPVETGLEGVRLSVYRAMDGGIAEDDLLRDPVIRRENVQEIIHEFLANRWILRLDDRYLNLSVPMDECVPSEVPLSVQSEVCRALYLNNMVVMWGSCNKNSRS